jgi:hypothetical protein
MTNYAQQIARDGNLLNRPAKSGPKKRKPMSRVSKRRVAANHLYSKQRKLFLASNRYCEALVRYEPRHICTIRSQDVHHIAGRLNGNLLNEGTWMPVCRSCHDYIHSHPKISRSYGWLT